MNGFEVRIRLCLLSLRLSVFLVMLMWTLDKLVNPEHAAAVLAHFYGLGGLTAGSLQIFAIIEMIVIVAFACGAFRAWSYGLVFAFHAVSTPASYEKYLSPWDSLLFFAAWPMLAACLTLYLLRDYDQLLSVDSLSRRQG